MLFNIAKVPNFLTSLRMFLIPVICVLMYFDNLVTRIIAIILAGIACITDFFDGKIARKYNVCSHFGKCMDPIADKTLVMALIVMLVYLEKAWVSPCIAILFREFVVAGIREYVSKENHIIISVSKLAKIKTATQMFALLFLMIFATNFYLYIVGNILLSIAGLLSVITGCQYLYKVKHLIFE